MTQREKAIVMAMVKPGDRLSIQPIKRMPSMPKEIRVDWISERAFIYGASTEFDGYSYPFYAIDSIAIISKD